MEIYFDTKVIHEWLQKDIVGGTESRFLKEDKEDDDPMDAHRRVVLGKDNGTLVLRPVHITPVPLPPPFSSVDGCFVRVENNYHAVIELNNRTPEHQGIQEMMGGLRGLVIAPPDSAFREMRACLSGLPKKLASEYKRDYFQLEKGGLDCYLTGEGKEPIIYVQNMPNRGCIRVQMGGPGLKRLEFDSLDNFGIDIGLLAKVVNLILKESLEKAVERDLIDKRIPDLRLRLGPLV